MTVTRRIPGRCTYCGAHLRKRNLACVAHTDLLELDDRYRKIVTRGVETRPVTRILEAA